MAPRGLPCALGDHPLVDPVYVTDPQLVTFIRKRHKEFRTQEQVCRRCLKTIHFVYKLKKRHALARIRTQDLASISSTSDSASSTFHSTPTAASSTESSSSILPTQHTRISDFSSSTTDDEYIPSPNATNGTRLPHVQPIIRRNLLVRLNRDVMDMYTSDIIGG